MIFPSYIFLLVFLPAVLFFWYFFKNLQLRLLILTLASYVFYGWWDYRFTILMFASTTLDYICGHHIAEAGSENEKKSG
jgi:alginate O-acetyltransferase complex protein AlgI